MTVRYCHQCGVGLSLLQDVYTSEPLGTSYQLGKFMKHTVPGPLLDVVSPFETTNEGRYRNYVVNAATASGGTNDVRWLRDCAERLTRKGRLVDQGGNELWGQRLGARIGAR